LPSLELKIDEEYRRLVPPLTPAQYEALKESIRTRGLLNPLIVNPEGVILDGVNRFRACNELGIKPKYTIRKFKDRLEEKMFVIEANLTRRHLSKFQRIETALPLIEMERELAKERMLKGDPTQKFAEGEALEIVAKKIGISRTTIRQALWLIENASKEELDKLRSGEKSISRLYRELKNSMEKKEMGSGIPRYVAKLLEPPKQDYSVKINIYTNSDLATITLERPLIERIVESCSKIGGHPEHIIIKALEEYLRKLERATQLISEASP